MMHIETFREGKHNFVKLPKIEFDNLLEELEDLRDTRDAQMVMARIDAGLEESFPAEFVYALADAENTGRKIAVWREYRGLKRDALAAKTGVTGSYISMIENGKRKGDIQLFQKLAAALTCDIDDLL